METLLTITRLGQGQLVQGWGCQGRIPMKISKIFLGRGVVRAKSLLKIESIVDKRGVQPATPTPMPVHDYTVTTRLK